MENFEGDIECAVLRQQFIINDDKYENENEEIIKQLNQLVCNTTDYYSLFTNISELNMIMLEEKIEKFSIELIEEINKMNFKVRNIFKSAS